VFLSYGRGSTGRAVAPPAAPTPQFGKRWAREWKSGRFAGEHDAGGSRRRLKSRCVSPVVRESLAAFNVTDGSGEKTAFRMGGLKRRETSRTYQSAKATGRRGLALEALWLPRRAA